MIRLLKTYQIGVHSRMGLKTNYLSNWWKHRMVWKYSKEWISSLVPISNVHCESVALNNESVKWVPPTMIPLPHIVSNLYWRSNEIDLLQYWWHNKQSNHLGNWMEKVVQNERNQQTTLVIIIIITESCFYINYSNQHLNKTFNCNWFNWTLMDLYWNCLLFVVLSVHTETIFIDVLNWTLYFFQVLFLYIPTTYILLSNVVRQIETCEMKQKEQHDWSNGNCIDSSVSAYMCAYIVVYWRNRYQYC